MQEKGNRKMTITGSCFCGSITYKVEGNLHDARSCHCPECRKAFSSQASAYALVDSDKFLWVSGENFLTNYESKKGEGLLFCSICGSTLCGTYEGKIHGVTLGCVDGDPEISLTRHIFVGSKASWETIPKDVPQYEKGSPEDA